MSLFFWVKGWQVLAEDTCKMILRKNKRGFTLIEAMLAVTVLSIAAAGVLLPFTSGAAAQADGNHRTMAAKLAGDLLEQIVSKPFNSVAGSLNDIPDYNGYTETQGHVKDVSGTVFTDPAYAKFSRTATCQLMTQPGSTLPKVFMVVTVKVSYGGTELISLTRLVSQ